MEFQHPLGQQLDTLLNDSEGVQLFHKFLSSRFSLGHLLDFWFACKGFRSIIDGDDQLKLLQVAKAIYRTYIKTDATSSVPVIDSTKREIRSVLAAYSHSQQKSNDNEKRLPLLRSLFDIAQADIQNLLARSYFLEFLHSDSLRIICPTSSTLEFAPARSLHHGLSGFSDPLDNQNNGNFMSKNRLQGDRNLCLQVGDDTIEANYQKRSGDEKTSFPLSSVADTALQLEASKSALCFRVDQNSKLPLAGGTSVEKSLTAASRRSAEKSGELVTTSELIAYMSLNSELHKVPCQQLVTNIGNSNATTTSINNSKVLVASDARKPGTNLAELDPSAFAQTLSHRLEKVKESRGKMEKLLSRMHPADSGDNLSIARLTFDAPSNPIPETQAPPPPPIPPVHSRLSSRRRASSNSRFLSLTPLQNESGLLRRKLSTLICDEVEDAQVILEDHCSRIWTDENEQQLSGAAGEASCGARGVLNVCPPARKGRHHNNHHNRPSSHRADVYSISSFDSGVVTCGGLNSSDSESCVSRHRNRYNLTTTTHQKHCFHDLPEECRWNPQICSFCRRPSMHSTPAPLVKEGAPLTPQSVSGGYQWGGQYQSQYSEGGATTTRGMRSRSLTSDSPSVFDSGMSSTYDHLPITRRSRQDQYQAPMETFYPPTIGTMGEPINGDNVVVSHRLMGECDVSSLTTNRPHQLPTSEDYPHLPSHIMSAAGILPPPSRSEKPKPCGIIHQSQLSEAPPSAFKMVTPTATSSCGSSNLVVGYYLCDDPVPYRTVWTGSEASDPASLTTSITLGQFKQLVAKKGVYRYFFKTASDDFGTGVVNEEIGDDNAMLPLWEGKVIARVERAE